MTEYFLSLPALGAAAWLTFGLWKVFEKVCGKRLPAAARFYGLLLPAVLLVLPAAWIELPVPAAEAQPQTVIRIIQHVSLPQVSAALEEVPAVDGGNVLLLPWLEAIWMMGVLILFVGNFLRAKVLFRRLKKASTVFTAGEREMEKLARQMGLRKTPKLFRCAQITTPVLFGMFRPVIFLPAEDLGRSLSYALIHELTHYRCRDLWVKGFLQMAACVQWFNPLGWLLVRAGNRFCEEACDCRVVRDMDQAERQQYGLALLEALGRSIPAGVSAALSGSGRSLERRLLQMMNTEKAKKRVIALIVAVAAALGCAGTVLAVSLTGSEPEISASGSSAESEATLLQSDEEGSEKVTSPQTEELEVETSEETDDVQVPETGTGEFEIEGTDTSLLFPLSGDVIITAEYGDNGHNGLDMTVEGEEDAPILAAAAGTVTEADFGYEEGWYLKIQHADGLETVYSHCRELLKSVGDEVAAGEQIAVMGSTGNSTGPHCHLEVIDNGVSKDPMDYLS